MAIGVIGLILGIAIVKKQGGIAAIVGTVLDVSVIIIALGITYTFAFTDGFVEVENKTKKFNVFSSGG